MTYRVTLVTTICFMTSAMMAEACSRAVYHSKYGTIISRTTDWEVFVHPTVGKVGRDQFYAMHNGTKIPVKYGYVGFYEVKGKFSIEAHNEKGLSIALLYDSTVGFSKDQLNPKKGDVNLLFLADYVASQFTTVKEAVAKLKTLTFHAGIIDIPAQGKKHMPVHFQINDKNGNTVIIEFRKGKVMYYENEPILTNAPQIPEQKENLKLYRPWGGKLNMPGDIHSKDRFVRASNALMQIKEGRAPKDVVEAYVQGQHLLHTLLLGARQYSVYDTKKKGKYGTLWTTYYDMPAKKIVFHSTRRAMPFVIDMDELNFAYGRVTFDAEALQGDITQALNPSKYEFPLPR